MKKKDNTTGPFSLDDLFGGDNAFDFGGMDLGDTDELLGNFDFDFGDDDPFAENRFVKPKIKVRKESFVTANNALKLAQDIDFHRGDRVDCYVTGNFVFGDFIQAFMDTYKIKARKMTLATLSMNAENIAMLANLLLQEQVDELNLLISSYFYAYERNTGGFIPLIQHKATSAGKSKAGAKNVANARKKMKSVLKSVRSGVQKIAYEPLPF